MDVGTSPQQPHREHLLQIRDVVTEDIPRLAQLELELFPEDCPYSEKAIACELAQPYTWYFVAEQEGKILGYAGLAFLGAPGEVEVEIHTIGVDPRAQRRGIGRALMQTAIAAADSQDAPIFLEVRTDNKPALGLYQACGFQPLGLRKNYYESSGSDAFTMRRNRKSEMDSVPQDSVPQDSAPQREKQS